MMQICHFRCLSGVSANIKMVSISKMSEIGQIFFGNIFLLANFFSAKTIFFQQI